MMILGRQGIGNYLQMLLLVANEAKGPLLLVNRLEFVFFSKLKNCSVLLVHERSKKG